MGGLLSILEQAKEDKTPVPVISTKTLLAVEINYSQ